jgi:hypothetical protein
LKQDMKNGKSYEFESINERNTRLEATAESMFLICSHDSLTIAEYEITKALLDRLVYNKTVIRDQSNT